MKLHSITKALIVSAALLLGVTSEAKTIGIWKDSRIGIMDGVTNSLTKAGWQIEFIHESGKKSPFKNPEALAKYDVLYFPGGWGRYFFPQSRTRKAIIRYVASGGGVILSGFRGGYTRTANRPMFPEVAEVYNRLSSSWIFPFGNSDLAKSFKGKPVTAGSGDHLTLKVGKNGNVFAVNSGDPVGAFGEVGYGRVIVYGGHFAYYVGDDTSDSNERLLFAMLKYLTDVKKPSAEKAMVAADLAEANFIRRERMLDLTLDERGPDTTAGVIPMARDTITSVPEALAYKLDYFAKFLPKKEAEECLKRSQTIKKEVNAVMAEASKMKSDANNYLNSLDIQALNKFKFSETPWAKTNVIAKFATIIDTNVIERTEQYIATIRPKVLAEKRARILAELKEDLKTVPQLIEKMKTGTNKEKREAALEIGRIQPDDKNAIEVLVKLLDDSEETVRTQAAISLGWMQCKEKIALDALVEKTSHPVVWDRRRAVQALGNIGVNRPDVRSALLRAAKDTDDSFIAQLGCLALGHIKAKEAKDDLLEIAQKNPESMIRGCAITALGYIGDKSVIPQLEEIAKKAGSDWPRSKRLSKVKNFFSFGTHGFSTTEPGDAMTAQFAIEYINNGGRKEAGVKQVLERRSKDLCYAITKNCQSLAGRIFNGTKVFGVKTRKYILSHLKEAGFTGVHNAWGSPAQDPNLYLEILREASDLDLIWIDTLPGYASAGKTMTELRLDRLGDVPAVSGYWAEETWPEPGIPGRELHKHVEKHLGKDWRTSGELTKEEIARVDEIVKNDSWTSFGCTCNSDKRREPNFDAPWNGRLRTLVLEIENQVLVDMWKESQDYLHAARIGLAHTFVVSTADPVRYPADNKSMDVVDSIGLESYQSFGRSSSYFMQRYRDGEGRSSMSELYNWYCPSAEHARLGFWQNAIHSKCFYNFALYHIFKYASSEYLWVWSKDRWEEFRTVYKRVAENKEYYKIVPSAANIAVLFSGRSSSAVKASVAGPSPVPERNDQNAMAIWVALGQIHRQADVVYADGVTVEKLSKYKILYMPDSKFIADEDMKSVRAWVEKGGVLIAEGGSSLFDGSTLKLRKNYALSDVFGVDYKETKFLPDDESDTFCRRRGEKVASFKFVADLEQRYHLNDSIHRDLKPEKSVKHFVIGKESADFMPGIKAGTKVEFDAALGVDIVKETTARKIASYKDGNGAVYVNEFGKGRCYFLTAQYPMMGHVTSHWEMMPNKWVFWNNVLKMLDSIVDGAYAKANAHSSVEVTGLNEDVEVTVDDYGDKYVVHMLDYDVKTKGVKGAKLTVPGNREIKRVFYPDTKTEIKVNNREVILRDFINYDMLVVEFK